MLDARHPILATTLLAMVLSTSLIAQGTDALRLYGTATPGTGGKSPEIWAASTPRPGNAAFGLLLENGKANAAAVAFFAQKSANAKFGSVGVLVDLSTALQLPFVTLDANGNAAYKLPLPNLTALIGLTGYAQAFVADSGGAAPGFSATQGLAGTMQSYGLLIGTRSSSDTADRQAIVNLDTGKLTTVSNNSLMNGNIPSLYPKGGTHCLIPGGLSNNVTLWDCRTDPPKYVSAFNAQATPWAVTYHPDGLRAYVVNQSSATGTPPEVQVVWGTPGVATFGTAFPGGNIKLGKYIDMWQMEFTSDGNTGVIASFGFVSPAAEVRKYDTKLGSTTYHQVIGSPLAMTGEYIFSLTKVTDKIFAIATAPLGGQVAIQLIDIPSMKAIKLIGRSQFGAVVWGMKADPRGRYLYVANSPNPTKNVPAGIVRVGVDPNHADYGKTVNISAGFTSTWTCYNTTLSAAGDKLYAVAGTGYNNTFVGSILEYDTSTLKLSRTISANGLGNMYYLLTR